MTTIESVAKGFMLVAVGMPIGHHIEMIPLETSTTKVELTDAERSELVMRFRTFPTTILIRIKTREEFASYRPPLTTRALAFTMVDKPLCEIWLPEGQEIVFAPKTMMAIWASMEDSDTIAHEILHCLRGAWHPAPVLEKEETK